MPLPHPDFEMYENVGRTTEQITAQREDRPTAYDLRRWADHDAREFSAKLPGENAGQSIRDWTRQLHWAHTAAELDTVAQAVLSDAHSGLAELHLFLESVAEWCELNDEPSIAARYRQHAEELSELGDRLACLSEDHLAGIYRRTNRSASAPPPRAVPAAPAAPAAPARRSAR
ncbi:hypothetical protein H9Y04_42560 [Streptomyces sp. TRM66268-LWL]|uniref:Uncharacterized protein n=1 Tax=Streptomyces polyasparticus TaxID=2767826 RepID=A0ABR7SX24_9ACTN|nr:hypothetical protein [Streptomyces polyasparticus]MBC9719215.1 hypothetical protein [Streptomyces polyasparticus]